MTDYIFPGLALPRFPSAAEHFNYLHGMERFCDPNPSTLVQRFVTEHFPNSHALHAVDLGCGNGRTAVWLAGYGFSVHAVDGSTSGLASGRKMAAERGLNIDWRLEDMAFTNLSDESQALAVAFGSFYYGTRQRLIEYIAEMHRLLAFNGIGFLTLRTTEDCRFGRGEQVDSTTFRLETPETNEAGLLCTFVSERDIVELLHNFATISYVKSEVTLHRPMPALDSDWMIAVRK